MSPAPLGTTDTVNISIINFLNSTRAEATD